MTEFWTWSTKDKYQLSNSFLLYKHNSNNDFNFGTYVTKLMLATLHNKRNLQVMWQYLLILHLQVYTFFKYWPNTCEYYLNTYEYCHNTCKYWVGEYTLIRLTYSRGCIPLASRGHGITRRSRWTNWGRNASVGGRCNVWWREKWQ